MSTLTIQSPSRTMSVFPHRLDEVLYTLLCHYYVSRSAAFHFKKLCHWSLEFFLSLCQKNGYVFLQGKIILLIFKAIEEGLIKVIQ